MENVDNKISNILSAIWADVSMLNVKTDICDYIIELKNTGLRFALEINDNEDTLNLYRVKLANAVYRQGAPKIPVVVALYDTSQNALYIGIALSWRFNTPIIEKNVNFILFSEENADKILDLIKTADETIRVLENTNCKVLKRISFRYEVKKQSINGIIEYLRDFTYDYKMNSKKTFNEKGKFERLLNGIPEEEYPIDIVDEKIFDAVQNVYSDAKVKSSLLLFTTELRDIKLMVEQSHHYDAKIEIMPFMDYANSCEFQGVEIASIVLDVYTDVLIQEYQPKLFFESFINLNDKEEYEIFKQRIKSVKRISWLLH